MDAKYNFHQYFSNITLVSFISGGKHEYHEKTTLLQKEIDKTLSHNFVLNLNTIRSDHGPDLICVTIFFNIVNMKSL